MNVWILKPSLKAIVASLHEWWQNRNGLVLFHIVNPKSRGWIEVLTELSLTEAKRPLEL